MLKLSDVSAKYFEEDALKQISLNMQTEQIVSLVGANGAGKSTVLKAISGLVPVVSGRIILEETDITHLPPHRRTALGIGLVPEGRQIINCLNVLENLLMGAYARCKKDGMKRVREDAEEIFEMFPALVSRKNQMGRTLSGGEQQMLAIGRGLMGKPRVLLLDEPSLGLAPLIVKEIFQTITRLREMGHAILLVEQNARLALRICNYAYVIENGRIVLAGEGNELMANEQVKVAYLGSAAFSKEKS
jgi:branched-chain amino acid transport system ATP-binding protein